MQEEGSTLTGHIDLGIEGVNKFPLSFNGVMKNYFNLYGDKKSAELFPIFSREELADANLTLSSLLAKIRTIVDLHQEKFNNEIESDNQARQFYLKNTISELEARVLAIGESKLPFKLCNPDIKYEEGELPEMYLGKQLQSFRQRALESIEKGDFTEEEFIDALIATYPKAFISSNSIIKDVNADKNSDKLYFDTFI
jgi:hypothetical protein